MSEVQDTKRCCRCKANKPLEEFHRRKKAKDGRNSTCKSCDADYRAAYRVANLDATKEYQAAYRNSNKPVIKKRNAAYQAANKDAIRIHNADYRAACRLANPQASKEYQATYRISNKPVIKKRAAAYRVTPAGRAASRRSIAKRRALLANVSIGDLKAITAWEKTWRTAKSVPCHWCGKNFPGKDMQADHRIPINRNGPHEMENLVVSCTPCNLRKRDMIPEDFNATLEQPWLFF